MMPDGDYDAESVENKWRQHWVENHLYAYPGADSDGEVFSIDTPPPTVSGKLHMGHIFAYTLEDFMARFKRMQGVPVFHPYGYDNNGIASEILTEKELGIRHQDFSRREFQEKCREVCIEYEAQLTNLKQRMGLSIDWDNTYKTISPGVQRV